MEQDARETGAAAERRVIVVGGGAAGMLAAYAARRAGAPVLLLEKMPSLGAKLRISGQGRCNLTNVAEPEAFLAAFGATGPFLRNAFHRFFVDDLRAFLTEQGVALKVERGGRVFPRSDDAGHVVEALARALQEGGVTVRTSSPVSSLSMAAGAVRGVIAEPAGLAGRSTPPASGSASAQTAQRFAGGAVVVCTGGASYPQTGCTGDGYRWAEALGHTIVPLHPALVPVVTVEPVPAAWRPVTLRNVRVTLEAGGRACADRFGEVCFTTDGLAGPAILALSRTVGEHLRRGAAVQLLLDLKPALQREQLDARLQREFAAHGSAGGARAALATLLPRALVAEFLARWGVPGQQRGGEITRAARRRLAELLQRLPFTVRRLRPLAAAIVTAGGIACREVDPRTLASRKVRGLFFAGELLDVDAITGGYNLQAAFSTGWLAGEGAAAHARGEGARQ